MGTVLGLWAATPMDAASRPTPHEKKESNGQDRNNPPPFRTGEKLTYHFYWGIFMVGRGTFEVKENDKDGNYVFTARGKSNDLISAIYPVEIDITSFFDFQRMRAVRFIQNRKEGTHRTWEETFFFYKPGQAGTTSYLSGETWWFEIPKKGVQDKLSTIYHMRCLDWKNRDRAEVVLGNDKGNYEVKMTKLRTETVELDDFAPMPAFKVEPNAEYMRGFVKKGKMWAWVTDDRFKVPVRVVARLAVGTVTASLVKIEGIEGWPYHPKD